LSFLYKALLKDNQQSKGNQPPQQTTAYGAAQATINANSIQSRQQVSPFAEQAMFAQDNKSQNGAMWFVIAVLLLVIGLLVGFIWGNQIITDKNQATESLNSSLITQVDKTDAQQVTPQTSQLASQNSSVQSSNVQPNDLLNQQTTETKVDSQTLSESDQVPNSVDVNTVNTNNEKQVDIALDTEGKIVSRVSDLNLAQTENETALEDITSDTQLTDTQAVSNNQDTMALDEVSDALKASFEQAVKATELAHARDELFDDSSVDDEAVEVDNTLVDITELNELDAAIVPRMTYQMHMYSSNKADCWVKINDRILVEGDELVSGLTLLEIRADNVIWQSPTKRFSQTSLEDY